MARGVKSEAIAPSVTEKRKPGRPKTVVPPTATRVNKAPALANRVMPAPAGSTPKLTKDELRAKIEKLEETVAALRAKSRETNKAAKLAAARIAELEAQVTHSEKATAAQPDPAK
jgi:hypothetical protein